MMPYGLRITTALLATGGWQVYVTRPKRKGTWVHVPDPDVEEHYKDHAAARLYHATR
jgi:hypothetical protein